MGSIRNSLEGAFNEGDALATFDNLVSQDIIKYGPSYPQYTTVHGFEFEFTHRPSWVNKPRIPTDPLSPVPSSSLSPSSPEYFGPGSDILKSHPSQLLAVLSKTHILALNIYPSSRPHYLILTLDSFRRQDEPLDAGDVAVAWAFLKSLPDPGGRYVVYNCGAASGCSRPHKHLQVARRPHAQAETDGREKVKARFFPDLMGLGGQVRVPYKYFLHRFESGRETDAEEVFRIYRQFLLDYKGVDLDLAGSMKSQPHNVILTSEWLLVIPRRYPEDETYLELLPNAAGMMGFVSSADPEILERCRAEGPAKVLGAFGLPP